MSEAGPASSPRACSGERYAAVPSTEPTCVMRVCSAALAMPKSASLTVPSRARPAGCPASRRGGRPRRGGRSRGRGRRRARSRTVSLDAELLLLAQQVGAGRAVDVLHDDVVAVAVGSSWPESNTWTMFGCWSRAAASASRRKRATKSSSSARCSASSFTATGALEHGVDREEDGGHAARAEPALDAVAAGDLASGRLTARRPRAPPPPAVAVGAVACRPGRRLPVPVPSVGVRRRSAGGRRLGLVGVVGRSRSSARRRRSRSGSSVVVVVGRGGSSARRTRSWSSSNRR